MPLTSHCRMRMIRIYEPICPGKFRNIVLSRGKLGIGKERSKCKESTKAFSIDFRAYDEA